MSSTRSAAARRSGLRPTTIGSTVRPAAMGPGHSAACCEPHVRPALAVSSSFRTNTNVARQPSERDRQLVGEVPVLPAYRALVEPARQQVPGDSRRGQRGHLLASVGGDDVARTRNERTRTLARLPHEALLRDSGSLPAYQRICPPCGAASRSRMVRGRDLKAFGGRPSHDRQGTAVAQRGLSVWSPRSWPGSTPAPPLARKACSMPPPARAPASTGHRSPFRQPPRFLTVLAGSSSVSSLGVSSRGSSAHPTRRLPLHRRESALLRQVAVPTQRGRILRGGVRIFS